MNVSFDQESRLLTVTRGDKQYRFLAFQLKGPAGLVGLGLGVLWFVLGELSEKQIVPSYVFEWYQNLLLAFMVIVLFVLMPFLTFHLIIALGKQEGKSPLVSVGTAFLKATLFILLPAILITVLLTLPAILSSLSTGQ